MKKSSQKRDKLTKLSLTKCNKICKNNWCAASNSLVRKPQLTLGCWNHHNSISHLSGCESKSSIPPTQAEVRSCCSKNPYKSFFFFFFRTGNFERDKLGWDRKNLINLRIVHSFYSKESPEQILNSQWLSPFSTCFHGLSNWMK